MLVPILFRPTIVDPSGLDQLGPVGRSEPISCAARRRIRAIEFCVSRLFSVTRSTTSHDVGTTCRQIESGESPRLTPAAARVLCYRVRPTIR